MAEESSPPFNAVGTGTLYPLHILQFLSNSEKNQLLNTVATTQVNMGGVTVEPEPPGSVASTVNQGLVAKGSVLARGELARSTRPRQTEVALKPVFAFEQLFRYADQDGAQHSLVVGDALNEIGPDVVEAVTYLLSAHKRDHETADSVRQPFQPPPALRTRNGAGTGDWPTIGIGCESGRREHPSSTPPPVAEIVAHDVRRPDQCWQRQR